MSLLMSRAGLRASTQATGVLTHACSLPTDLWHDKKNLKKHMTEWGRSCAPALKAMVSKLDKAARKDGKALTDAALGTAFGMLGDQITGELYDSYKEFEDAASALTATDAELVAAQTSTVAQEAVLRRLHGAPGSHGAVGDTAPQQRWDDADEEEVRSALEIERAVKCSANTTPPVPSLSDWQMETALKVRRCSLTATNSPTEAISLTVSCLVAAGAAHRHQGSARRERGAGRRRALEQDGAGAEAARARVPAERVQQAVLVRPHATCSAAATSCCCHLCCCDVLLLVTTRVLSGGVLRLRRRLRS